MYRPTHITGFFGALILMLCIQDSHAGSATWKRHARSGDWNTKTNWTPAHVPNGAADTAFFDLSNTIDLSISANTEVNGILFDSNAGLNPFTITVNPNLTLTISGVGITNNSGTTQHFVTADGTIVFSNSATAGSNEFTNNGSDGGQVFKDTSSAGSASIHNDRGIVSFFGRSSAGSADITGFEGGVSFSDRSTAGNATISEDPFGGISFSGNSSAGSSVIFNGDAGRLTFSDHSTAGSASIGLAFNGGSSSFTLFSGSSTAGSATISGSGEIQFSGFSKGGTARIDLEPSPTGGWGILEFFDSSTAGSATIINNGGVPEFEGFVPGSSKSFFGTSTAGNATIIARGGPDGATGGSIFFGGNSTGGKSRIEVFANGSLDISFHNGPGVIIGSIEGDGNVFLGANNLTVGSNNLSTTFSGVIQDGGQNGGVGGSLTKMGSGTFDLTAANTYTGNTNINGGVLKVDGSITSDTFVNHGGTLAGTGTINGNVTNNGGTVSPGDAPGTLTVASYTQASGGTLLIDIAGASTGQFSILDVLGNATVSANGFLLPVLLNGFVPTVGESFTFMDYSALTGTFSIHDRNIDSAMEHWDVTYQPTAAILTVAAGNVSVPDLGSTLLLLTLSLLGLGSSRHLLRKQF